MVHKTGPRPKIVEALHNNFYGSYNDSPAQITEGFAATHGFQLELIGDAAIIRADFMPNDGKNYNEVRRLLRAMHKEQMKLVRRFLRPLERDGCSTCPQK